jgi:hypothetical protein
MGNSISMGVAYRDQDLDGSTIVNSSVNGATAAQSAFLAGATAGVQVANKAVIADSNLNIGSVKALQLSIGVSGSEIGIEGVAGVTINATTLGTLTAGGDSVLSSSKISAFTLAAPLPGITKRLFATHASTTAKTVTASSGVTFGGVATVITFGTSDALGDQSITLRGLTTTLWGIAGKYGTTVPVTS